MAACLAYASGVGSREAMAAAIHKARWPIVDVDGSVSCGGSEYARRLPCLAAWRQAYAATLMARAGSPYTGSQIEDARMALASARCCAPAR